MIEQSVPKSTTTEHPEREELRRLKDEYRAAPVMLAVLEAIDAPEDAATEGPRQPSKKTREIWHPPLTAERRAQNVAPAKAFLDRYGCDSSALDAGVLF